METEQVMLLVNAVSTLFLVGLIWFVQVVHYPGFKWVDRERFGGKGGFEMWHEMRTSWVVIGPMVLELGSSWGLVVWQPGWVRGWVLWLGGVLVLGVWVSTFGLQVPCHRTLEDGFDERAVQRLIRGNWLRTWLWTARGVIVVWMIGEGLMMGVQV